MKKLKCKLCYETWYVEERNIDKLCVCPYCAEEIRKKNNITEFDSLDKAIYGVIVNTGIGIFENRKQLFGHLLDIAPGLRKEIHIFDKACNKECLTYVKEMFEKEVSEAEQILFKLRHIFIEEEGLSENWADMLSAGILGAVKYTEGIGISDVMLVEVENMEFPFNGYNNENMETPEALVRKGDAYCWGEGVEKNRSEAAKWYKKAAEQGHADAQYKYANCLFWGEGVVENKSEAIKWYKKAAEQGNVDAQHEYAFICGHGINDTF